METLSALLALCAGNSSVTGEFSAQKPVTRSFDVFIDLRLGKRLSKQSWGWWFETPWRSLWRHWNGYILILLGLESWWMAYITLHHKERSLASPQLRSHATPRHFPIWMRTVKKLPHVDCRGVLGWNMFSSVNKTKNPQHLYCCRSTPSTHGG